MYRETQYPVRVHRDLDSFCWFVSAYRCKNKFIWICYLDIYSVHFLATFIWNWKGTFFAFSHWILCAVKFLFYAQFTVHSNWKVISWQDSHLLRSCVVILIVIAYFVIATDAIARINWFEWRLRNTIDTYRNRAKQSKYKYNMDWVSFLNDQPNKSTKQANKPKNNAAVEMHEKWEMWNGFKIREQNCEMFLELEFEILLHIRSYYICTLFIMWMERKT